MKEERNANIIINKAGGNAGSGSLNHKISLPNAWMKAMGINPDNKQVKMTFDGEKIIIEK